MMARKWIVTLMLVLVAGLAGSAVAHAARGDVEVSATINDQNVGDATTASPVRLEPGSLAKVVLDVTNRGDSRIVVKRVELSGNLLGLSFYRYVASTELVVEPGDTGQLSYFVDLTDLERQATGLIRGNVKVTDDAGRVVATIPTVTDVRGSLWSVTGLFGLALIVFTVLAFVRVGLGIAQHRLPRNRAQRGLRFLLPGIGLLLVLGFTASVLRWWSPPTGAWFAAAGISAVVFFALGFFSPMPGDEDDDYFDEAGYDQDTDQYTDQFTDDFGYTPYTDERETIDDPVGEETAYERSTGTATISDRVKPEPDKAAP